MDSLRDNMILNTLPVTHTLHCQNIVVITLIGCGVLESKHIYIQLPMHSYIQLPMHGYIQVPVCSVLLTTLIW